MYRKFIFIIMLLVSIVSNAQLTTYYYGQKKVQSKGETAALYSVAIYENQTWVTVELIPTRNRSWMNYWTSRNTYIIVGNGKELPIIGFLDNNNEIDTDPFSGNWGWSNVKKDQKYHYTMVFEGKIPPGVTNFTLKDKGTYGGAHGYGFSNYTLNNPRTGATSWSEFSVKQNVDSNNDGICGIYEGSDNTGYKLGCVKQNGEYLLVYLGSNKKMSWWQIGDIKAELRQSATNGFLKADWYMADKTIESNSYVVFDGSSMKTIIDGDETFYLKMYPTSTSGGQSLGTEKWSGTGIALNNGYIATNYHVVENAKTIKIKGIRGNYDIEYNATVISTDKFNDLAIIKVNDRRFNGFGAIPYRIKNSTAEVGEDVFVLGYPLTTTMGEEVKLTTGVISSKTGFQGNVSHYQISAPIQPGNSGGPLFDKSGNLIGIVKAKHTDAENVGYAIKISYLKDLAENASFVSILPTNNMISGKSLSDKVKCLRNFVFMITCSNLSGTDESYYGTQKEEPIIIHKPSVESSSFEGGVISKITLRHDYTAVEILLNNGSYESCNIDKSTFLLADGKTYTMTKADGIKIAPEVTHFSSPGQNIRFTLYFPPIPFSTTSMTLFEPVANGFRWSGIRLKY